MKKLIFILLFASFILTGCSHEPSVKTEVLKSYGHNYVDGNAPYSITTKDEVEINYLFYNKVENPLSLGVFLFANGIPQKLYTQNRSEAYMQPVFLNGNDEQKLKVNFKPVLSEKENAFDLTMVTLDYPFHIAKKTDKLGYKRVLMAVGKTPLKVEFPRNTESQPYVTSDIIPSSQMSANDFIELGIENHNGESAKLPVFAKILKSYENDNEPDFMLRCNNEDDTVVQFVFVNNKTGKYRISFFVDHQLIKINNGMDFIDIETASGEIVWTTISIDKTQLKNLGVLYAFCVPIETVSTDDMKPVRVTNPMTLFFEETQK